MITLAEAIKIGDTFPGPSGGGLFQRLVWRCPSDGYRQLRDYLAHRYRPVPFCQCRQRMHRQKEKPGKHSCQ